MSRTKSKSFAKLVVVTVAVLLLLPALSQAATVYVNPGDDLGAIVDANPAGTIFIFNAGTYRQPTEMNPKDNMVFRAATPRTAILNGSRLLTSWTYSKGLWYASNQTQEGPRYGEALPAFPRATYPEDLWVNGVRYTPVTRTSELGAGKWYFDYAKNRIYLSENPAGKTIETSVDDNVIVDLNGATGVVIDGLVFEKYANPAQNCMVWTGVNWTIQNCEIRNVHGVGILINSGAQILNNYVHDIGQIGMGGGGTDILIDNNEIANCNYAGYDMHWEAGGMKVAESDGVTISNNYSHDNFGPGLWTDIDNYNVVYEYNQVYDNCGEGITHEISYNAIIRYNTIARNGDDYTAQGGVWLWDSQILIQNSANVQVYGNDVWIPTMYGNGISIINQDRPPYVATGSYISDNDITWLSASEGMCGGVTDNGYTNMFTANDFDYNRYHISNTSALAFTWDDLDLTFAQFQSHGQEAHGTIDTNVTQPPTP